MTSSRGAEAEAAALPLTTRFVLGPTITAVQHAFLAAHGFLLFDRVASDGEVAALREAVSDVSQRVVADGLRHVRGVPVWIGGDPDGRRTVQRLAFTSTFSPVIEAFVRDARFEPLRTLVGEGARLGLHEKDGVVLNRYLRAEKSLRDGVGWHTDGLRDVFYGRLPRRQLNVGLHLNRIRAEDGGLRILPGSHRQGVLGTLFRKPYFVSQRPDPQELVVETEPGDLTVHDGRMWHRVAPSTREGWASERISLYVPYVTDAPQPKTDESRPRLYHRVFDLAMRWRRWRAGI